MRGGGLLVVNKILSNSQNLQTNLEIIAPDDPTSNVVSTWSGGTAAFTHGTGTVDDPYLVESADNLAYLSANYSTLSHSYFKQIVDIDLANRAWTPINAGRADGKKYCYDGDNHKILRLNVNVSSGDAGLFGANYAGYIKNLGIESGTVTNTGTTSPCMTGGILGFGYGTVVTNCYNKATIQGASSSGGIYGAKQQAQCYYCTNYGNVTSSSLNAAGISGEGWHEIFYAVNYGKITGVYSGGIVASGDHWLNNCVNYGEIVGSTSAGGLYYASWNGTHINNCINYGKVLCTTGDYRGAGGLIAYLGNSGGGKSYVISNSFNAGEVVSGTYAGGIVGTSANQHTTTIENCYNTGVISGGGSAGIVAYIAVDCSTTIKSCYNTALIKSGSTNNADWGGGIVGSASSELTCENCYNTGNVNCTGNNVGGILGHCNFTGALTITNCFNKGNVIVTTSTGGGIVGWVQKSSQVNILRCFNEGVVYGGNKIAGGIIGSAWKSDYIVNDCYNIGAICSLTEIAGGLIGGFREGVSASDRNVIVISNSFSSAQITSPTNVGALIGHQQNNTNVTLNYCYANSDFCSASLIGAKGSTNVTQSYSTSKALTLSEFTVSTTATKPSQFNSSYASGNWAFVKGQIPSLVFKFTKPSVSSSFTYDGHEKIVSLADFSVTSMNIVGSTANVNAGTYEVQVSPLNNTNYKWSDGTTAPITLSWTINKASLTKPTMSANLTFNASAQSPIITGFDNSTMEIVGTQSATNAGNYQFSISPKANYQWSDGTDNALIFNWTIAKQSVNTSALPSQSGTLTYNTNPQNVSWTSYDTTKFTVGGTTSATNAGTYLATFTPTANYQFSDGASCKTVSWIIAKQTLTTPSLDLENNQTTFSGTTKDMADFLQDFNANLMLINGNTQAIRAGTYIFIIHIKDAVKDNYVFANGQNFVIIEWTILPYNIENGSVSVVGH